jgi:hypothetical protein
VMVTVIVLVMVILILMVMVMVASRCLQDEISSYHLTQSA